MEPIAFLDPFSSVYLLHFLKNFVNCISFYPNHVLNLFSPLGLDGYKCVLSMKFKLVHPLKKQMLKATEISCDCTVYITQKGTLRFCKVVLLTFVPNSNKDYSWKSWVVHKWGLDIISILPQIICFLELTK